MISDKCYVILTSFMFLWQYSQPTESSFGYRLPCLQTVIYGEIEHPAFCHLLLVL